MESVDYFPLIEFLHVKWSFVSTFELTWLLLHVYINITHLLHIISISIHIQLTLWSIKSKLLSLYSMIARRTLLYHAILIQCPFWMLMKEIILWTTHVLNCIHYNLIFLCNEHLGFMYLRSVQTTIVNCVR